MLDQLKKDLRKEIRKAHVLSMKHLKYMSQGYKEGCPYVKKDMEFFIKKDRILNFYRDTLIRIERILTFDTSSIISFNRKKKIEGIILKFKLNYLINFIKFIQLNFKTRKFQKENFTSNNEVLLEDLYSKEALKQINAFLLKKYNISLKEIESDITVYKINFETVYDYFKTPYIAAYFPGGRYKKSIFITDFPSQGKTIVDDNYNSEFLIHELTHYLQFTKGYARLSDMLKSIFNNLHLAITGKFNKYNNDKLEKEARSNQEEYKYFLEKGELKLTSRFKSIIDLNFSLK